MRYKMCFFSLFLLLFTANSFATERPPIRLVEGINQVSLSVLNHWESDINGINVEIDKRKLPTWISVLPERKTINVQREMRGSEKFILTFIVSDAPLGEFAEIPYILKDNTGNQWNFSMKVYIGSNEESTPLAFDALYDNFPNPFNPITTIKYSLKEDKYIELVIYNSLGQEIRTLVNTYIEAGMHTVKWDGKNNNGQKVSSGLYVYRLQAGNFTKTKRMLMLQ